MAELSEEPEAQPKDELEEIRAELRKRYPEKKDEATYRDESTGELEDFRDELEERHSSEEEPS